MLWRPKPGAPTFPVIRAAASNPWPLSATLTWMRSAVRLTVISADDAPECFRMLSSSSFTERNSTAASAGLTRSTGGLAFTVTFRPNRRPASRESHSSAGRKPLCAAGGLRSYESSRVRATQSSMAAPSPWRISSSAVPFHKPGVRVSSRYRSATRSCWRPSCSIAAMRRRSRSSALESSAAIL